MYLKSILDEDFVNYKKPSMYLAFPYCTFKCEKDCGIKCCQNSELALAQNFEVSIETIIKRYLSNPISKAVVCCGLEPLDSYDDIISLLTKLRFEYNCDDDFVIYTGYKKEEILDKVEQLSAFKNVIIKFGRFIPNAEPRFDDILKVRLASSNQYAEKIS